MKVEKLTDTFRFCKDVFYKTQKKLENCFWIEMKRGDIKLKTETTEIYLFGKLIYCDEYSAVVKTTDSVILIDRINNITSKIAQVVYNMCLLEQKLRNSRLFDLYNDKEDNNITDLLAKVDFNNMSNDLCSEIEDEKDFEMCKDVIESEIEDTDEETENIDTDDTNTNTNSTNIQKLFKILTENAEHYDSINADSYADDLIDKNNDTEVVIE